MKKNMRVSKIQSMFTLIATFGLNAPIYSCMVTFTNDSEAELLLVDKNDSKAYKVGKNKTVKFGSEHVKAQFALFDKKPKSRSFSLFCTCSQQACGGEGGPKVAYSDIVKGTEVMNLFSVNKADNK